MFARYQLESEARASSRAGVCGAIFVGYANGCMGYVPTADEFDLGGYEVTTAYKARLVSGGTEEYQYINSARPLSLTFRILTGFPPRHFVSLEPAAAAPSDNMPDRQG